MNPRVIRLKGRLDVGNSVYYEGDCVNLDRHPDVEEALRKEKERKKKEREEKKVTQSPQDKMERPVRYKTK